MRVKEMMNIGMLAFSAPTFARGKDAEHIGAWLLIAGSEFRSLKLTDGHNVAIKCSWRLQHGI
jgi:hypothetical protein